MTLLCTLTDTDAVCRVCAGGRSDEAAAALVVRHARSGPHAPAHAQQPAGRDDAAQRTEVRPPVAGTPRRTIPRRPLHRDHPSPPRTQV